MLSNWVETLLLVLLSSARLSAHGSFPISVRLPMFVRLHSEAFPPPPLLAVCSNLYGLLDFCFIQWIIIPCPHFLFQW